MPIEVFGTTFQNPILLASGTAGFGLELWDQLDLEALGGVVTKAVTPEPRRGHPAPRVAEFPGGMLNAIGLANPGLDAVARHDLPELLRRVRRARVIVNVAGDTVADYVKVITRLTTIDGVAAFEINASCPNTDRGGLEFGADPRTLADLTAAVRRSSTRPIVIKLSPVLPDIAAAAAAAKDAGADGFTCINTIPGRLDGRLGHRSGGVSGPALLAVGVLATQRVADRTGLPVIGVGGIRTAADVRAYLDAGARLVAVGTAALAHPRLPERLARATSG
jgi:dihydroorotate dehydrogenase (NAD+) catalytic subunit